MFLIIGFFAGLITFPILFRIQKILHLPTPDLSKKKFHIHHSFWGLTLVITGFFIKNFLVGLGLGFIVHHELSEPGLKGLGKFIYINQNK